VTVLKCAVPLSSVRRKQFARNRQLCQSYYDSTDSLGRFVGELLEAVKARRAARKLKRWWPVPPGQYQARLAKVERRHGRIFFDWFIDYAHRDMHRSRIIDAIERSLPAILAELNPLERLIFCAWHDANLIEWNSRSWHVGAISVSGDVR